MIYPSKYGSDPLFPDKKDFKIVYKNHIVGSGIITLKPFKKGDTIAKLAGDMVQAIRPHTFQVNNEMHLDDNYFLGYFIHSCVPNTKIDTKKLIATAIKDIDSDTFITIDYTATEDYLFRQFRCNCGNKKCRKVIAGKKERKRSNLTMMSYYEDDDNDDF
jgi:hypothetical protein